MGWDDRVIEPTPAADGEAWPTGPVVPVGDEQHYWWGAPGEPGFWWTGSGLVAATSGSMHALRLAVNGDDAPAVFLMEAGGGPLQIGWQASDEREVAHVSMCWTGESFAVALPTASVGLRTLALRASGGLLTPVRTLVAEPAYLGSGRSGTVTCQDGGFTVAEHGPEPPGGRLYRLDASGDSIGEAGADLAGVSLLHEHCVGSGDGAVCATEDGVARIGPDGSVDRAVIEQPPGHVFQRLLGAGDATAVVWISFLDRKYQLGLTLVGADGDVLLPPTPVAHLAEGEPCPWDLSVAFDGTSFLAAVVEATDEWQNQIPRVFAFDTEGRALGDPVMFATGVDPRPQERFEVWDVAVLWEGDAFGLIWMYQCCFPDGPILAYRAVRVEP